MKKLFMSCVVLMLVLVSFCFTSICFAGDLNKGFRGIEWGSTSISTFTSSNYSLVDVDDKCYCYAKVDDNLTLGDFELTNIIYCVNRVSKRFDTVYITSDKICEDMATMMTNAIGVSYKMEYYVAVWKTDNLLIKMDVNNKLITIKYIKKKVFKEKGTF